MILNKKEIKIFRNFADFRIEKKNSRKTRLE